MSKRHGVFLPKTLPSFFSNPEKAENVLEFEFE